jgi:hypothetical protein
MLGMNIRESSVSKYMLRSRKPPWQQAFQMAFIQPTTQAVFGRPRGRVCCCKT